jgi:RNA polymerase subunit RPABC4/transcription elongation factor Spt4
MVLVCNCSLAGTQACKNCPRYIEAFGKENNMAIPTIYGWICPKCGRVLTPNVLVCPYCEDLKMTCNTRFSNNTTTYPQWNQGFVLVIGGKPTIMSPIFGNC